MQSRPPQQGKSALQPCPAQGQQVPPPTRKSQHCEQQSLKVSPVHGVPSGSQHWPPGPKQIFAAEHVQALPQPSSAQSWPVQLGMHEGFLCFRCRWWCRCPLCLASTASPASACGSTEGSVMSPASHCRREVERSARERTRRSKCRASMASPRSEKEAKNRVLIVLYTLEQQIGITVRDLPRLSCLCRLCRLVVLNRSGGVKQARIRRIEKATAPLASCDFVQ
jgi:hypothetical protein